MDRFIPAREVQKQEEVAEKNARTEYLSKLNITFGGDYGVDVMAELFRRCGWNNSNSGQTQFFDGRKSIAEELAKDLIDANPDLFLKVVKKLQLGE